MDFACINIAPPAAIIQEMILGRKLRILPLPEDLRQMMKKEYSYGTAMIKKEMYSRVLKEDIPTITNMSDNLSSVAS